MPAQNVNREERRFKELVKSAKGTVRPEDQHDLARVYRRLGLGSSQVMSTRDAGSACYERITKALEWSDKRTGLALDKLKRHLVLRHLADDAPFLEGISLLSDLCKVSEN